MSSKNYSTTVDDSKFYMLIVLLSITVAIFFVGALRGPKTTDGVEKEATEVTETTEVAGVTSSFDVPEIILLDGSVDVVQDDGMLTECSETMTKNTVIGKDRHGKEYTASELCERRILLHDKHDDKSIYFLGSLNENGNWDSCCITNVYSDDGVLLGACQSCYDDGKQVRYRSFVASNDKSEWVYTKYETGNDQEDGRLVCRVETYEYASDLVRQFKADDVEVTDILTVYDDLLTMPLVIKSFYTGKMTDNEYDDSTGDACFVGYDKSGFVKYLYKGCFKDGGTEDNTGNAYTIDWDRDKGCYVYCNDKFSLDSVPDFSLCKEITVQDIQQMLNGEQWAKWLRWVQ